MRARLRLDRARDHCLGARCAPTALGVQGVRDVQRNGGVRCSCCARERATCAAKGRPGLGVWIGNPARRWRPRRSVGMTQRLKRRRRNRRCQLCPVCPVGNGRQRREEPFERGVQGSRVQAAVAENASLGGVSPFLQAAENCGGPCIDNMCFRYVKGKERPTTEPAKKGALTWRLSTSSLSPSSTRSANATFWLLARYHGAWFHLPHQPRSRAAVWTQPPKPFRPPADIPGKRDGASIH